MPRRSSIGSWAMTSLPPNEDLAAGRLDEPVDHLEAGRLAAAGRADQDADLARRNLEAEIVDRHDIRVAPLDVTKFELYGLHPRLTKGSSRIAAPYTL